MKGSTGTSPYADMPSETIATSHTLCVRLQHDLNDWNRFVSREQIEGLMGPDDEILQPPASPGKEPAATEDLTGVASRCLASQKDYEKLGWKILRTKVTLNHHWGVVWRADVTIPEFPDDPSRVICWQRPGYRGKNGLIVSNQPLEMFDPKASIKPLDAQ
jgi:hypothetical protein